MDITTNNIRSSLSSTISSTSSNNDNNNKDHNEFYQKNDRKIDGSTGDLDLYENNKLNTNKFKQYNDNSDEFRVNQLHTINSFFDQNKMNTMNVCTRNGEISTPLSIEYSKNNKMKKTHNDNFKRSFNEVDEEENENKIEINKKNNEFSLNRVSELIKSLSCENLNKNLNLDLKENFSTRDLVNFFNGNYLNLNVSDRNLLSDMRLNIATTNTMPVTSSSSTSALSDCCDDMNTNCEKSKQTTTTVFVKSDSCGTNAQLLTSSSPKIITTNGINQSQSSLTIQVNQSDENLVDLNNFNVNVNKSSGVSVVNCYNRAVPINNNEINENVNNIENVQVNNVYSEVNLNAIQLDSIQPERTFTSTEAQTDDLQEAIVNKNLSMQTQLNNDAILMNRDMRRRDRRDRRQARRLPHPHPHPHPHPLPPPPPLVHHMRPPFEILPDLLNNHLPPPYTTLPGSPQQIAPPPPPPPQIVSPIVSTVTVGPPEDVRYAFSIPVIRRYVKKNKTNQFI